MDIDFIERLERRLTEDLPGQTAQLEMAPRGRELIMIPNSSSKVACVMAMIFPKNDDWYVSLIKRTSLNPNDPHSGQISLPGGKMEETDDSYFDCALRETQEEIGIKAEDIGLIGELTSLYVSVSNFLIYPFIGFTSKVPNYLLQETEVQEIMEVPIDVFIGDKYKRKMDMEVRGFKMKDVPYYKLNDQVLWGATAMIMSEFGEIAKEIY